MISKLFKFLKTFIPFIKKQECSEDFRILELKPRQNLDDLELLKKLKIQNF
jgi:hypothetical protein